MRKKLLWWLVVGFLVGLFCSGALARMAGNFEIPAKWVVKPVVPVRAPAPVRSRDFADSKSSSRSFRDSATGIKFVKIPQGCFKMGQSPGAKAELIANEGQ